MESGCVDRPLDPSEVPQMLSRRFSVRGFGGTVLGESGFASFESSHRALVCDRNLALCTPFLAAMFCDIRASGRAAKQLLNGWLIVSAPCRLLAGRLSRSIQKDALGNFSSTPFGMAARHSGAKLPFAGILPAVRLPSAASRHRETKISFALEPHPFLPTTASAAPSKGCSYLQTFLLLSCFCFSFSSPKAKMNSLVRSAANSENALSRASLRFAPANGRCPAAYARLASQLAQKPARNAAGIERATLPTAVSTPLRSRFLPADLPIPSAASQTRFLHVSGRRLQEDKPKTEAKPVEEKPAQDAEQKAKSEEDPAKESEEKAEGKEEGKAEGEDGGKEKKEDLPPPPPHGDKTPWQVFMETMNTELTKSQEWNESTKQIAASANQFTESESVRRAREAYEKSTSAISSATTGAVKTTATAIGKGAAWTWDTSAMKGVRKAANVTGDALDKATKPIRDTEAYKNVKDVIDDGSSSRYGGWVEKEERRKRREQWERTRGGEHEVLQEDPK